MQFRWVKCARGHPQHTANGHGNRRGVRVDRAGQQRRINHARRLRIGAGAVSLRVNAERRICQRPCRLEKRGGGERRHHGHVPSAGG